MFMIHAHHERGLNTEALKNFAWLTGNDDVHKLAISDLCTANSEISGYTAVQHV